jgi:hypothetical protein
MIKVLRILCLTAVSFGSGCNPPSINRIAYGTMESMQQQNCIESPMTRKQDCLTTESYDEYKRKRQAADAPL